MQTIKILILEHDPYDIELLKRELTRSELNYESVVVDNKQDFVDALKNFSPDIVLSDYSLPSFDGFTAFKITKELAPETPFIIVSGTVGDMNAVDLIKMGVTDYALKEKIYQAPPKILRALKEAKERAAKKLINQKLIDSEEKYRDLFHLSPIPMWVYDPETFVFLKVNEAATRHYGYSKEEFLNLTIRDIRPSEDITMLEEDVSENKKGKQYFQKVYRHIKKNQEIIYVNIESNVVHFDGKEVRLVLATDITERTKHIQAIEDQNKKLQEIAWMQSHVVRAPLSRLMGLINCIKEQPDKNQQLLCHVLSSAEELDKIIRGIVGKTDNVKIDQKNEFESFSSR